MILRQSTAVDVLIGPFLDRTDGFTAEVGESPTVLLSKNGQTPAAKNDVTTPVHASSGYYNCELDATDTNTVGTLVLLVAASANALPVRHELQVVTQAVYDAMYASGATGPNQTTPPTAAAILSEIDSNSTQLAAILTDTGTTLDGYLNTLLTRLSAARAGYLDNLNGHTPQTGDSYARIGATGSGLTSLAQATKLQRYISLLARGDVGIDTDLATERNEINTDYGSGGGGFQSQTDGQEALRTKGDTDYTNLDATMSNNQTDIGRLFALALRKDSGIAADLATELSNYINFNYGSGAGNYDNTTDSIEAIRDRGDSAWTTGAGGSAPTAADNAAAVWNALQSAHTTAGSFGELATEIASILADTNELQGDWTNGGRLDLLLDALPTLLEIQSAISTELGIYDGPTKAEMDAGFAALNDPDVTAIADAVLDEVYEGSTTMRQFLRLATAALFGKLNGAATTTINIRDIADTKNRITATVDADGNRTAVTTDAT